MTRLLLRRIHTTRYAARDLGARFRRPPHPPPTAPPPPPEPTAPAGPHRRDVAVDVAGVRVPPRPIPPGDEACCMSGCVHCVLTLYAEDVEAYEGAALAARAALEAQGVPRSQWPTAVTEREDDEAEAVHPSMAAFLALEGRLNKDKPKPKPVDPTIAAFLALESKLNNKEH